MFGNEPAVVVKVMEEIIRALVPMALIFGWVTWTPDQTGAVLLFVGVVVGGLTVLLTRSQVVPVTKSDEHIRTALNMPANTRVSEVKAATAERVADEEGQS